MAFSRKGLILREKARHFDDMILKCRCHNSQAIQT